LVVTTIQSPTIVAPFFKPAGPSGSTFARSLSLGV
jgi:hypothetical protein